MSGTLVTFRACAAVADFFLPNSRSLLPPEVGAGGLELKPGACASCESRSRAESGWSRLLALG